MHWPPNMDGLRFVPGFLKGRAAEPEARQAHHYHFASRAITIVIHCLLNMMCLPQ